MRLKDYLTRRYQRSCAGVSGLIELVPEDALGWTPCETTMPLGALVNHLAEALDFPQRVLERDFPTAEEFQQMTRTVAERSAAPQEALDRIAELRERNLQALQKASEDDLSETAVHPVFGELPAGELMLFFLEHLTSHRHQLFHYLKQRGLELSTAELYGFPG